MSPSRTDLESWHRHHCIGDSAFVPIRTFPNHLLDSESSESVDMSESSESELESLVSASCNISGSSNSISPTSADMSESSESESVVNFGNQTFFEGVEKLLEVWFTKKSGDPTGCDLRKISRDCLEKMLKRVRCVIISKTENIQVDAYVLSESSMFISQRRFILKTCGTTTPLECLTELLDLAKLYTGFDDIEDIFYSRKNFERPDLQRKPHRSFEQEVATLDGMFADGAAYCMGTLNHDCWYLYALNPLDRFLAGRADVEPDQTIEILMTELDPKVMQIFTKSKSTSGQDATQKSGIDLILPSMKIDDYLFDPCGYSMNGILKNEKVDYGLGEYMTIHITPEPEYSYVSFESNIPLASYLGVLKRVLDTFQPGKFILTIFANRTSMAAESHKELQKCQDFGGWVRKDIQYSQFQNYELTYGHFVRFPS